MGDPLEAQLYTTWRSKLADPMSVPVWGNVDSETREQWVNVAARATAEVMEQAVSFLFSGSYDAERRGDIATTDALQMAARHIRAR